MTKSLSGAELVLDDAPARGRDLFFIDGNSLAHRAFHALPEDIATSWGQPTNALLGFANVLFKLLVDFRPRGVAVAWDRKPVHRLEAAHDYKAGRKPMAGVLARQFPHFGAVVAAFGYPNVALEGWEADDVIATLVTRAEAAALTSVVVSTDRDAFQLVSARTCLMMTPRGVRAPEVYTEERVRARYGIEPGQIPDFIALKGDAADNIAAVPGIGEKTAAELLRAHGSLAGILAATSELSPARKKTLDAHREAALRARELATMQRALPIACDPRTLVASPPDRSSWEATFSHFEFKRLLERRPVLDKAIPPLSAQ